MSTRRMLVFLTCLARAVGVVPVRETVAVDAVPMRVIVPAVAPVRPATPCDEGGAIFVEAGCDIGDARAFVAVCHRPTPYPDTA